MGQYSPRNMMLPEGEQATLMVNTEWHEDLAIYVLPLDGTPREMIGIARATDPERDGKVIIYTHCWTMPPMDSVKLVATDINNNLVRISEAIYISDARSWTWNIAGWNSRVKKNIMHCSQGITERGGFDK